MGGRLLIVINSVIEKHGSMEDFLLQCADKARATGWALTMIFPRIQTPAVRDLLESRGCKVIALGESWRSPKLRNRELMRRIDSISPDIINFHFCDSLHFLRVFRFARRKGARVVWHYHGEIRPLDTLTWRNKYLSSLRLLSLFVDLMIPVSEANNRFLTALNVYCPTTRIYNGIDCHALPEPERRAAREKTELLYLGSLIERKRVDFLLRAFAKLREIHTDVHLSIVGGGHLESQLRNMISELNLQGSVDMLGLIKDFPYQIFESSDVFVSASCSESFGLVFAEAMMLGLPVVACAVGGIPEVVLDAVTGYVVPVDDADAFVSAMCRLVSSPGLRAQFGLAGREHVLANFCLRDRVNDLFQVFREFSKESGPPPESPAGGQPVARGHRHGSQP